MSEQRAGSLSRSKTKLPFLRTTDIARAVGVHANTVRVYEAWGFLPPVPRASNGYRLYTHFHLDHMRLARAICRSALARVRQSAAGDVRGALSNDLPGSSVVF